MPVFRREFIFGKKLQQLFEKARDFELFFRGFGGFFRGNLNELVLQRELAFLNFLKLEWPS